MELNKDKESTLEFSGVATTIEDSNGEIFVLSNNNDDDWILDSKVTFHVTSSRDWFSTFQDVDGGNVLMSNMALVV